MALHSLLAEYWTTQGEFHTLNQTIVVMAVSLATLAAFWYGLRLYLISLPPREGEAAPLHFTYDMFLPVFMTSTAVFVVTMNIALVVWNLVIYGRLG